MLISINERPGGSDNADPATRTAVVRFDHGPEYPVTLRNPFSEKEEQDLEWYFEDHLRQPFLKQVKARDVAASIKTYGERLFQQIFADMDVYAQYKQAVQANIEQLRFEIAGSPEFLSWHWEALKDPRLPRAFALEAPMMRKNLRPTPLAAQPKPSPILHLLIVTARPHGQRDAGYRTISRPLIDALTQADLPIDIEILRPGTYQALADHLQQVRDQHGAGYYSVIHLDVHGAVLNHTEFQAGCASDQFLYQARYGRPDIAYYDGSCFWKASRMDRQTRWKQEISPSS